MSSLDTIMSNTIARGLSNMANASGISASDAADALRMIAAPTFGAQCVEPRLQCSIPNANWRDSLPSRKVKTHCAYCRGKNSFSKGHCINCGASEE